MCIIVEVFDALGLDVVIRINHRKILDGLFAVVGVSEDKIRTISSAVDKLDKLPWAEVKQEMEDKGLQPSVADDIGSYLNNNSKIDDLRSDARLSANPDIQKGLADMDLLFTYLHAFNVADKVSFDLTLARGLDYYTGLIFELIQKTSSPSHEKMAASAAAAATTAWSACLAKRQSPASASPSASSASSPF